MKKFISIIAGDIASENFSKGELITFGLIVPTMLVIITMLASHI